MHTFWLALISTVVAQPLGALWYSPVMFAVPWVDSMRVNPKELDTSSVRPYVVSAVSILIQNFFVETFLNALEAHDMFQSLFYIVQFWLAFSFAPIAGHYVFALPKFATATLIDSGHSLATLLALWAVRVLLG